MSVDPPDPLDPEDASLLRSARADADRELGPAQLDRLRSRLEASIQPPPAPTDPSPPAGSPPAALSPVDSLVAIATSKLSIGVVSLLVGGVLGFEVRGLRDRAAAPPEPSVRVAAQSSPSATPPLSAEGPVAPASSSPPLAPPPASVAAAPGASASAAGADPAPLSREESLRAERAILDVARTAVGRGQGAAALAALDRHAHDFPRGRLSEEREGMIIQALLMSGRSPEARSRLERFRKSFPRSMMLPALDAALGEGH